MHTDSTLDPTVPVSRQLDAYNARDIDAFMAWWAADCQEAPCSPASFRNRRF